MLCDELKWKWAYGPYLDQPEGQKESAIKAGYVKVVSKQLADEVIAELKAEIESLKASHYAEMVDAGMRERKLKRALYKLCDNWAVCEMDYWRKCLEHYEDYFNVRTDEDLTEEKCERMIDNWRKVAHNCRAKAEGYK